MAMNVVQAINVVKAAADDIRSQRVHDLAVDRLSDRLRWILMQRGFKQRQLGVDAGLAASFISAYFTRAKIDPDASMSADNLAAIAKAARVSHRWLSTGEGSPDDRDGTGSSEIARIGQPSAPPPPIRWPGGRFKQMPGWEDILRSAKLLEPDLPQWAWDDAATFGPIMDGPLTPQGLSDLARWFLKNRLPPEARQPMPFQSTPRVSSDITQLAPKTTRTSKSSDEAKEPIKRPSKSGKR